MIACDGIAFLGAVQEIRKTGDLKLEAELYGHVHTKPAQFENTSFLSHTGLLSILRWCFPPAEIGIFKKALQCCLNVKTHVRYCSVDGKVAFKKCCRAIVGAMPLVGRSIIPKELLIPANKCIHP